MEHPDFGPIEWNAAFRRWTGRVRLDFFSDYFARASARAEGRDLVHRPSSPGEDDSASQFELELIDFAWRRPSSLAIRLFRSFLSGMTGASPSQRPSRRQRKAFAGFLSEREEVCNRVADAVYDHYRCHWGDWREPARPGTDGPYHDEVLIPELTSRDGLKEVIRLNSLTVLDYPGIKMGVLGFCFSCSWDGEHGLGVLVRDGEVIEIGENDITWRGPPSAGEYRPKPATLEQLAMQSGIAAVKKLGGRVQREAGDVEVDLLRNDRLQDADLAALRFFPEMRQLRLASPGITDAGLETLKVFKNLRLLELSGASITNSGLGRLLGLRKLEHLYLTGTKVTDEGLKELRSLPALAGLHLGGTGVTSVGVREVGRMSGLKYLDLSHTRVTDEGIRELKSLTGLLSLNLARTPVTDAALAELKELQSLRYLTLSGCPITDLALEPLKALESLRSLQLDSTLTTEAGAAELQQAVPELRVVHGPQPEPGHAADGLGAVEGG